MGIKGNNPKGWWWCFRDIRVINYALFISSDGKWLFSLLRPICPFSYLSHTTQLYSRKKQLLSFQPSQGRQCEVTVDLFRCQKSLLISQNAGRRKKWAKKNTHSFNSMLLQQGRGSRMSWKELFIFNTICEFRTNSLECDEKSFLAINITTFWPTEKGKKKVFLA